MASRPLGAILQQIRTLVGAAQNSHSSDGQLLERFVSGRDQAAFAELVQEHGPMVMRVCRALLCDANDADDAFQATFLVLVRKAASLDRQRPLGGWLHAVAARIALKARSSAAKRRVRERQAMSQLQVMSRPTHDAEEHAVFHEELRRLPDKYREPIVLCYLQGRTHEEAARHLGWPVGSMSWHLGKGVELLRKRLARRGMTVATSVLITMLVGPKGAALPAALLVNTVQAGLGFASGRTAAISTSALTLAQGACRGLAVTPIRIAAGGALAICIMTAGVAGLLHWSTVAGPADNRAARADKWVPAGPDPDPLPPGAVARLGSTRLRPGRPISSVAFAPDGKTVVSGNWGASIHFWDVATGKELQRIAQQQRGLHVEMSPDGKLLASAAGNHKVIQLWDVATGQELRQLTGHQQSITCFAFAPDGEAIASAANDNTVRIWRVATGEQVRQFERADLANRLAWSKDGKILALGTSAGKICLWDSRAAKLIHEMTGHERHIFQLCWSPDDKILASGGSDGTICLWDPSTGQRVRRLGVGRRDQSPRERRKTSGLKASPPEAGYLGIVQGLVFSADGELLYSGGQDFYSIFVWEVATGNELRRIESPQNIHCMARSRDGRTLAVGSSNRIDLWDLHTETLLHPVIGPQGRVGPVAFSPDGNVLATGSDDESIHIWQTATWRELERLPRSDSQAGHLYVEALRFSPDGKLLAVGGPWRRVSVWDWAARKEVRCFLDKNAGGSMPSLAFSPDGKMLAAPFAGITVWDMTTGKELHRLDGRGDGPNGAHAVAFSPDGRRLALGGGGVIWLYEPTTRKVVRRFELPQKSVKTRADHEFPNMVSSIAFSRDGKSLLSGGYDATLRLWEIATGKERRLFDGHELHIHSVAFSPDERYVASASGSIWEHQDNSVRVWDAGSGKELRRFTAHQSVVISIAFSPDGNVLASGSEDGTTLIWDMKGLATARQTSAKTLSARGLESLWTELADDDAAKAYNAIQTLIAAPMPTEAFLQTKLQPAGRVDPKQVSRWVTDLDSNRFAARRKAARELEDLGELAERALRRELGGNPSNEARRQIEGLLKKLEQGPAGNQVRSLRAVEVLEHRGTAEARRLLKKLATGLPEAILTKDAQAALARLAEPREEGH